MQTKRLIIALLLSSAILFLWTYFTPRPPQNQQVQSNPAATPAVQPEKSAVPSPSTVPSAATTPATPAASSTAPKRIITISTPLYQAKFDTLGGEPISWIIIKNKRTNTEINSSASTRNEKVPLQLISPKGLELQPREVPLQLRTGDSSLDQALSSSTYKVEGVSAPDGDAEVKLAPGERKQVTFVLEDNSGLQVRKTFEFDAERYDTDLAVLVKRGEAVVPQVKLTIGPSIGDQGVARHTFYSVAPEAIGFIGGSIQRHAAAAINVNKNSPDHMAIGGAIDWAGVGDTYFAMVAVSGQKLEGAEYRTVAYEHKANGSTEKRYLITGFVPITADGSRNVVYTGPKDHYLLTDASREVTARVGRSIDLDGLIDYGWLAWISRPLAVPILACITYLHQLTGSYGIAIILFTIGVYSLFFPLKWRSSKAMKKAQKLAPQMKELQEKIKGMKQNDPRLKELQMEQLRLMKEGNPLGGCLPLLIQMPFLFALYRAITISVDFRQATFLWLPDLSGGDPFHILEVLMAGTMIVLQLITPAPSADPMQRKIMAIGMPIFMLYVLWGAPSGLLVYWLVGNIVGFTQQFVINRWTQTEDEKKTAPATPTAKLTGRKKPA
ncbi:MAG TPA: membrane protein insertase YidC [Pyrinomonadaceae bacterium]|nr:membrane protein insertase YidC [Pyrinomonadaceae bacterium]